MKSFYSVLAMSLAAMVLSVAAQAQSKGPEDNGWRERIRSEKIAFLTVEMDLTPEEAQAFWPVYNQADKERFKSQEAVFKAFRDLDMALRDGKGEKELAELVRSYARASSEAQALDSKYLDEYLRILPGTKVAKLCVGEEKFRQQQIFRLRRGRDEPSFQDGWRRDGPREK